MHNAAGVNFVQDSFGKCEYLAQCEQLGIIPSTQVVKFLEHDELDLTHYGLGDKVSITAGAHGIQVGISMNVMMRPP